MLWFKINYPNIMPRENIENPEDETIIEEIEENVLPPENIVVLNELRSAADLYRLMSSDGSIDIQPNFQRDEVWGDQGKARFIDSLAKEFPIPSMCFALDPKEQKYIVIDGLQRMSTIKKFLGEIDWVLPKLVDIDKKISGKSVKEIKKDHPEIFRRIENISLPVTILRYDPSKQNNMEYIFTIFQRLNTFGERLNNQEIRNAIFQGPFNSFIRNCAKESTWVTLTKTQIKGRSNRMISEEKALRFFAFYERLDRYDGKLNKFLNDYMQEKRNAIDNSKNETVFTGVLEIIKKVGATNIGKSNAIKDAVLYGISKNLEQLRSLDQDGLKVLLNKLNIDKSFGQEELSQGIQKKQKVIERLTVAEKIFSGQARE